VHRAIFHEKALEAIRGFPDDARRAIGSAISDIQHGARPGMPLSRPMPSVGPGVHELRVRDRAGIYRSFYTVVTSRGVLVFHAFVKKTQKTPHHEIELAQQRLRELLDEEE
jgi:phage-related protein